MHKHRLDVFRNLGFCFRVYFLFVLYYRLILAVCKQFGNSPLQNNGDYSANKIPYERTRKYEHNDLKHILKNMSARIYRGCYIVIFISVEQRNFGAETVTQHD